MGDKKDRANARKAGDLLMSGYDDRALADQRRHDAARLSRAMDAWRARGGRVDRVEPNRQRVVGYAFEMPPGVARSDVMAERVEDLRTARAQIYALRPNGLRIGGLIDDVAELLEILTSRLPNRKELNS